MAQKAGGETYEGFLNLKNIGIGFVDEDLRQRAAQHLHQLLKDAEGKAALQTIVEIAKECGVTQIQGLPVIEFYETLRRQIVERRLPDLADRDATVASAMKQLWNQIQVKPDDPRLDQ